MSILDITDAEWTIWHARCRQELAKTFRRKNHRRPTPEEFEQRLARKRYAALEARTEAALRPATGPVMIDGLVYQGVDYTGHPANHPRDSEGR